MNLTTAAINEAFSICKTSVVNEMAQAEQTRVEEQRQESVRLNEEHRLELEMKGDIRIRFANLEKMVKSVFSKPSELSQFLLEKVLNNRGHHFLTRVIMTKKGRAKPCPEFGGLVATSMKTENVEFQLIDLVEIDSLSSERNRFFLALGIPSLGGFKVGDKSLCRVEPVVYRYIQAQGGATFVEECYVSTSFSLPANAELRDALKNLCDLKIFCDTILKKYQHLITS